MINSISRVNPYALIIPPPIPKKIERESFHYKAKKQLESQNIVKFLDILSVSPEGIRKRSLDRYIHQTELKNYDFGNYLKHLISSGTVELHKDRYWISDKTQQKNVYRDLGPKWRANYHNFYAHALDQTFRGQKSVAPEIAFHFSKAGNTAMSKQFLESAGDYLKETFKNNDAIKSYKKCLALLCDTENFRKLDIMIRMLEIMYTTGMWDEFNAMYSEAEAISKMLGDKESRAKVLNLFGSVCFFRGEVDKAIKTFHKAESLMLDNINTVTYAETMRFLGRSFLQMGKNDKAHAFFTKTLTIGERIGSDELRAKALENIGRIHRLKSEYQKAIEYYNKALPLYKKIENLKGVSDTLEKLGVAHFYMGNNREALKTFNNANRVNTSINYMVGICNNLGNIGSVYFSGKKINKAEKFYRDQLAYAEKIKNVQIQARAIGYLGLICEGKGALKKALLLYKTQLKLNKNQSGSHSISNTLSNLSVLYSYLGDLRSACQTAIQQINIDRKIGFIEGIARGYNNLGTFYLNMTEYWEGINFFRKSLYYSKKANLIKLKAMSLFNISECFFYLMNYKKAKKTIENLISLELPFLKKEIMLSKLKINVMLHRKTQYVYINRIKNLLQEDVEPELKAEIYYTLSKLFLRNHLDIDEQKYLSDVAKNHYLKLYNQTKKFQYFLKLK